MSVAIDASQAVFQHYKSGVIDGSACGTNLDHAVLLVGFDGKAWRLKNSWGISWGEQGMFRLAVDVAEGSPGVCGINVAPAQPRVARGPPAPIPPLTPGHHPALPCNCSSLCEANCKSLFGLQCCGDAYNPPVLGNCTCGTPASCPKCDPAE